MNRLRTWAASAAVLAAEVGLLVAPVGPEWSRRVLAAPGYALHLLASLVLPVSSYWVIAGTLLGVALVVDGVRAGWVCGEA
ncbi:MAG: hypothetical protein R3E98_06635 [Gemmatimonadota bacterium]